MRWTNSHVDTHSSVMVFHSEASFATTTTTVQQYTEHNNHPRLLLGVKDWVTIVYLILNNNTDGFKCDLVFLVKVSASG